MSDSNEYDLAEVLAQNQTFADGLVNDIAIPDITPLSNWVVFKILGQSSDYNQRVGLIHLPENKDSGFFLKCEIIAKGPDSKIPEGVTIIHVVKGGYPKGVLFISMANGHAACREDNIMGWEAV